MARISKEQLAAVLQQFAAAEETVKKRRRELKTAQDRADETSGLTEAAEREFNNADAKYRVAFEQTEAAAPEASLSEKEIEVVGDVLKEAEKIEKAINRSRTELTKAVETTSQCATKISDAVTTLEATVNALDRPWTDEELRNPRTVVRNEAKPVRTQRTQLKGTLRSLQANLGHAHDALNNAPDLPDLASLRAEVRKLERQRATAGAGSLAQQPGADESELDKLRAKRDEAKLAWRSAPDSERAAQNDLTAKRAALDIAIRLCDEAKAARDEVEQDIIERIDVGEPADDGEIELKAIFVEGFSPENYKVKVKWIVEAGRLKDPEGTTVQVKTKGVARGNYKVEAHLIPAA